LPRLADHELDGDGKTQVTLFSGRGILSESQGPVWMVGTGMLAPPLTRPCH
jgi:glucan 1,3-beta-glucosidase